MKLDKSTDKRKSKIENRKLQKAAFLDRDGTLIEEVNFLARVEDMRLFPFTLEAVELLKKNNFLIVVITNQSGIGRGIFGESDMQAIHDEIQTQLNGQIDAFYFCPHLPEENCACRKPKTQLIEHARADFAIDLENSWVIGDKKLDIETGFNARTKTALVLTGYGRKTFENLTEKPDLIAENLLEAARIICSQQN
jgi:D-glycero-D-manno-heptose 1,7-bisphosphate phosphatase